MSARAIEDLAADLGQKIYIDVAKWHLYLAEAKLHTVLAQKCFDLIEHQGVNAAAIAQVLQSVAVPLGGGQTEVPLAQLIPAKGQREILEILEECQRNL